MTLAFSVQSDIANVGLQLLGADQITQASFMAPDSVGAREMNACYDKLRISELSRNTWKFATRRAILRAFDPSTALWTPPAWSSTTAYLVGQVAVYNGDWYQAQPGVNTGDIPNQTTTWEKYFGPMTLDPFDTAGGTAYFAGDLVVVPEAWQVGNTYAKNTLIARTGLFYSSIAGSNVGNDPATDNGAHWAPFVIIQPGTPLTSPVGPFIYSTFNGGPVVYLSLFTNPLASFTVQTPPPNSSWLEVDGTVLSSQVLYPLGTGPSFDITTNNIFHMPYSYLKQLPTNPKSDLAPPVGGPAYNLEDDALKEGNFFVAVNVGPYLMRFVADVVDVFNFHPMFCEGLGARMAVQTCEKITSSNEKKQDARLHYKESMGEARTVNAIEVGTVDPVEDEFIVARL